MPWSPEEAREHAAAGGKARAEKKRLERDHETPEGRARALIAQQSPALVKELLKAARGEGDYAELDPKTRVQAIQKALEWGIGRPQTPKAEKPKDEPGEVGLSFE